MIDQREAFTLFQAKLKEISEQLQTECVIKMMEAEDFGWVFYYQSKKYVETGDIRESIVGNAPFIVDRQDGSLHVTGTAYPPEFYIEEYRKQRQAKDE